MSENVVEFIPKRPRFTFERLLDIRPSLSPWRVKGLLPATGLGFMVGESKAGKTFVALDMTLKLACGSSKVFGHKANPCGVVYVAAEDPEGCRTRAAAWKQHKHRQSGTPFELVRQVVNLLDEAALAEFKGGLTSAAERMTAEGLPLGIVVFDTLSKSIPGADENSSADMGRVLDVLCALAEDLKVLVLVVAHFGKAGSERGIRGWSGLGANADLSIFVERDKEEPDHRLVTFDKVKNGRDGHKLSFTLEQVELEERDEDGDAIVSCVPLYAPVGAGAVSKRRKRPLTPPQQIVFTAIKYVTDHGQTHPLPVTVEGAKPWQKAVTRADVKFRAEDAGLSQEGDKRNTKNVRFERALEAVLAAGYARSEGGLIWLL